MHAASGVSVGKDSTKFGKLSGNPGNFSSLLGREALERLVAFLLRLHPHKTAEAVEAITCGAVKADRVRKWLALQCAPDFLALLHLIRAYGADFLVFVIGGDAPESLLEAAIAERRARYLESVRKLEEEFESLSSR
ncbi:hypothetical protein EDE12_103144 [Methylosinus sp. sav-2]|uniref:hypothetical protein n=1 Tax=Methylosinus sp. sav-2 TaxID=2485168 RepID=UPI001065073D|nr:hypothetical protein [Methylosinus sp. sav-2]TDX65172.1 hypothetical protein EDE12_103144 [Methylosinus sp. sav-2]